MSYQLQQMPAAGTLPRKPVSKWWWIGLLIAWLVFFIIGGGLIGGASANDIDCEGYCDDEDSYNSLYYGAFACFGIGGALQIAYWTMLGIWIHQRRRYTAAVDQANLLATIQGAAPMQHGGMAQIPQQVYLSPQQQQYVPQPSPTPGYAQSADGSVPTVAQDMPVRKFCGNCGTPVSSAFCTQCGSQI